MIPGSSRILARAWANVCSFLSHERYIWTSHRWPNRLTAPLIQNNLQMKAKLRQEREQIKKETADRIDHEVQTKQTEREARVAAFKKRMEELDAQKAASASSS